jgi:hypothetical protein
MARAEVEPAVYTATPTLAAFNVEDADVLLATLGTHAFLRTNLTGTNNDLDWIARASGTGGLTQTVAYIDPAANDQELDVSIDGGDLVVTLATGVAGAITSTANDILAAARANQDVMAKFAVNKTAANSGAGVVIALVETALGDWTATPTLDVALHTAFNLADSSTVSSFYSAGAFGQKSAVGAADAKAFGPLGTQAKWVATVGGGTPVVAFSISAYDKRD